MKYLFFDTAVNGYYTLLALKKELGAGLPLIDKAENISDDAAPFIFEITDDKLNRFLSTEHISFKEILFLESKEPLATVRDYFSRFVVQTIKGREFYFRFWAANVFVKYIMTCQANQLSEFFRIADTFSCYEQEQTIRFSFDGKKLVTEKTDDHLHIDKAKDLLAATNDKTQETTVEPIKKKSARKFFS